MNSIFESLKDLEEGEETVIYIDGQAYVVSRATPDDIERICKGYFVLD